MSEAGDLEKSPGGRAHEEALHALLEQTRLPKDEVSARLESALSEAYWLSLCPQLTLGGGRVSTSREVADIDAQCLSDLLKKFAREGYFQTAPLFSSVTVDRMAECIGVLRAADWPPVFAFVYDEFWEVTRGTGLSALLSAALGADYRQLPHVWAHYVSRRGGAGWPPHTDSRRKVNRITVWVALSNATLDNGCIYLIPKNMAPEAIVRDFGRLQSLGIGDAKSLMQRSRALPAPAGTVLGWGHDVIHWGAACGPSGETRISISQEFVSGGVSAPGGETLLLDAQRLPSFTERLRVVAKAIVAYQGFEPLTIRFLELAERLLDRVPVE